MSQGILADTIIIGGGIVGACLAWSLAQRDQRVTVIDAGFPNATAAGMGHLLILDDNPAELAITQYSLKRWKEICKQLPLEAAYTRNGTLWIADSLEEMSVAENKYQVLKEAGEECLLLNQDQLCEAEPALRKGLEGGLLIPDDGIIYAPIVANWMLSHKNINLVAGKVTIIEEPFLTLANGQKYKSNRIVLANGIHASELLAELPIEPKKGHVLITDRYNHGIQRTLVELGYVASAHNASGPSTACNIQPRPTGQLFIGATRQFHTTNSNVEAWMVSKMLRRACAYVPSLANMNVIRAWTGFRAATPDGFPIIGEHPERSGLWLALGHEGLGVTTATATADLLCAAFFNESIALDGMPYSPHRLVTKKNAYYTESKDYEVIY